MVGYTSMTVNTISFKSHPYQVTHRFALQFAIIMLLKSKQTSSRNFMLDTRKLEIQEN